MSEAAVPQASAPEGIPYSIDSLEQPVQAKSAGLGKRAFVMALCVIVLSVAASILIAVFGTTVYHYHELITSGSQSTTRFGFNTNPNQVAFGVQALLGSVFGIWSLVLGIIATVTNRGRRWGIIAIVFAGVAPILSLIVWSVLGTLAGHSVYQR